MDDKVFDYLKEYIDHMPSEARIRFIDMPIYHEYQSEKRRLSDLAVRLLAQGKPLNSNALLADIRNLESLGNRALRAAKRLDPYGDERNS